MKSQWGKPAVSGYGDAFARGWERIFGNTGEADVNALRPRQPQETPAAMGPSYRDDSPASAEPTVLEE